MTSRPGWASPRSPRSLMRLAALPAALALAIGMGACGDDDDGGDEKAATTGAQQQTVVGAKSVVPRYAGDESATKPAAGVAVTELQAPAVSSDPKVVPKVRGSDAPLPQFLDTVGNDVATYWQQVFNKSKLRFEPNTQTIVTAATPTQCDPPGTINPDAPPGYCPRDKTVFLTPQFFQSKVLPLGDAAIVVVVASIYSDRILDQLGAFQAVRDGKVKAVAVQLQGLCMAGSYTRTVAQRNLLEAGDVDEILKTIQVTSDKPGTAVDDPNAVGTPQQRVAAFAAGAKSGLKGCGNSQAAAGFLGGARRR